MAARVSDELSEKDQEELTEEVWELIRVFKNDTRNFKCKRILGEGSYGVALLFQEDDAAGVPKRLFCAKCASADDSLEDLEREIQATEIMYNSLHHCQPIVENNQMLAPNNIPEDVDLENAFYRVTEYLHNGTLEEFISRIRDLDSVPNRVLWYIFQCLIRACIEMAFPTGDTYDDPVNPRRGVLEPGVDENNGSDFWHGDLASRNVMFGDLDNGEHILVPILKLIDYGLSTWEGAPPASGGYNNTAIQCNISDIGEIMTDVWKRGPYLDVTLRDLVERCINLIPNLRPTLEELIEEAEAGSADKTMESDDMIEAFVRQFVFNAPT
ncbi:putative serine threonine protein kinase protein [Eutypa lata UCREL1]|uniref:Putative serine threonine protein kinase protein n=1 Tax=Eutypa lata (strain UCR-EL1) TaxID=1287681 RepID=M7SS78_EUTLA|nr:putative serine threonine protein kinase protein [Eutypa lata UCREL1]